MYPGLPTLISASKGTKLTASLSPMLGLSSAYALSTLLRAAIPLSHWKAGCSGRDLEGGGGGGGGGGSTDNVRDFFLFSQSHHFYCIVY